MTACQSLPPDLGVTVAVNFSSGNWGDEIREESTKDEYQTCTIEVFDPIVSEGDYDYETDTWTPGTITTLYTGAARFIPVRGGVYQQGESQANSTTIRAVRFQLQSDPGRVKTGFKVKFLTAPYNTSLVGQFATVNEDFQGSTTAARTIHASMDADG